MVKTHETVGSTGLDNSHLTTLMMLPGAGAPEGRSPRPSRLEQGWYEPRRKEEARSRRVGISVCADLRRRHQGLHGGSDRFGSERFLESPLLSREARSISYKHDVY